MNILYTVAMSYSAAGSTWRWSVPSHRPMWIFQQ